MPEPDLCVIGGGPAGSTAAAAAAQLGARVVLVEAGAMGGAAATVGAVPIQALRAAARRARDCATAPDFAAVRDDALARAAALAPNHAQARLEALGVSVIRARAAFVAPDTVEAGGAVVRARRFVVATGAAPAIPPLPGLERVPHLTPDTIWGLERLPARLAVLGAGAPALELAQIFRRLGSAVTLVAAERPLPDLDEELAAVARLALRREGVDLREGRGVVAVAPGPRLELDDGARLDAGDLLVASGWLPRTAGLGLDLARIAHGSGGIHTDRRLRTTNRRAFAIGGVAGAPRAAHVAAAQGLRVLRHALFRLPLATAPGAAPQVVWTDPEVAWAGLSEAAARDRHGRIEVLRWAMADIDRAVIDGAPEGLAKVVLDRRGRVLGAGIAGRHAAELIQPWVLAIDAGLPVRALGRALAPHPAWADLNRKAAESWLRPRLPLARMGAALRLLRRLPD